MDYEEHIRNLYCYEDELPCELTSELFEASFLDGVRLYPWKAVAKQLEAELAGMELMDAEGEAFGETIVRENERLKAELAEKTKSAEEYHPDAVSFAKQLQQAQAERDALAREVAAMEIFINQVLNNEFAEWGKTKAYLELLHATRKEIEQERQ